MIEKCYWEEKGILWQIVTEREIPKTVFVNIQWLYSSEDYSEVGDGQVEQYKDLFAQELQRSPDQKITAIAQRVDQAYGLEIGETLRWVRGLLAERRFTFDLNAPFRELKSSDIQLNDAFAHLEVRHASS